MSGFIHEARSEAKPFLFVLYAAVGLIALIFFATRVPETNGRSLEEIEQQLQGKRRGRTAAIGTALARRAKGATGE